MAEEILFQDDEEETLLDTSSETSDQNTDTEDLLLDSKETSLLDTDESEDLLNTNTEENLISTSAEPTSEEELLSLHEENPTKKESLKIKTKVKFSLKSKISIAIAILLTIAMLLISITILNNEKTALLNEMIYRAQIISKNLSANLAENIDSDMDRHPLLTETAKIKDLETITLIDPQFRIIDSSNPKLWQNIITKKVNAEKLPKIKTSIQKKFENLTTAKLEESESQIFIYQPVLMGSAKLGDVFLQFTKKPILDKIHNIETKIKFFIGITILIGIVLSYLLISFLLSPFKKLTFGVRKIGNGDLKHKITLKTKDELEMLGNEFNQMTDKLYNAQKQIVEKGKLEEQIHIAEDLQRNLLPETVPELPYFEFDAYYKAARGVGGDYYDILQVSDDTIGTVIADVSGKGVPAAIIMVVIRTIFQSTAKFLKSPDRALHTINQDISGRTSGEKYATMFYYMYNFDNGILTFSNGGHNPLLVYHKKLNQVKEYDTEGAPVGVMQETQYEKKSIQLDEGDVIFLNTDGITEAENINHDFFDENMFNDAILKYSLFSAKEIKNKIMNDIEQFVGSAPQHDDMTLLVFKINKIPHKGIIKAKAKTTAQPNLTQAPVEPQYDTKAPPTSQTNPETTSQKKPVSPPSKPGLKEKIKYVYDNPTDIYRSLV